MNKKTNNKQRTILTGTRSKKAVFEGSAKSVKMPLVGEFEKTEGVKTPTIPMFFGAKVPERLSEPKTVQYINGIVIRNA
jgi:hypothetical protein